MNWQLRSEPEPRANRQSGWFDWFLLGLLLGWLLYVLLIADPVSAAQPASDPVHVVARVYSAVDCAPCKRMKTEFKRAGLAIEFEENEDVLDKMKIKQTPTTMIFVDDKRVWVKVGYISVQTMRTKLAEHTKAKRK